MSTRPVNPVTGLDFTPAVGDMPFTPLQREWLAKAHALGRDQFAARAAQWDREASFPFANYEDLREQGLLVVAQDDERLDWMERQLLKNIGERLYGTPRQGGRHG